MNLVGADYAVLVLALAGGVIGLIIGFSGALAFFAGTFAAAAAGTFGYRQLGELVVQPAVRGLLTGLVALLAFGLARFIVKRLVHGLLAQPGDAIFGALIAGTTGFALGLASVWFLGFLTGDAAFASVFVDQARAWIGLPVM